MNKIIKLLWKIKSRPVKDSRGVVMVVAMLIMLAITAIGLAMITNAALSSTIAKNYKNKIISFYAADGAMTELSQQILDSMEGNWFKTDTTGNGSSSGGSISLLTPSSATAFSTNGGNSAANAIDKNTGTRWESAQGIDPEWIYVDYGSACSLAVVVLDWETANAKSYTLNGSNDASTWTVLATESSMPVYGQHRIDSISVSGKWRYVKMYGSARNTAYGYSIWEFRTYGKGGSPGSSDSVVTLKAATASSTNGGNTAANAIDKNFGTRWESAQGSDPQWIYVDCGSPESLYKVVLTWEAAASKAYSLAGSNDASTWTTLASESNLPYVANGGTPSVGRRDTIPITGTYQYIRMYGTARTTNFGYSLFEFQVFRKSLYSTSYLDTIMIGSCHVVRSIQKVADNEFNLYTKAYDSLTKWGVCFQSPLKQYIERASSITTNPYGDTAIVPVTFYDFHSNRTNPEFEQPNIGGVHTGMVQATLDGDRKPVLGPNPNLNYYISKWFRPWSSGDSTIPIYMYTTLNYSTKHHNLKRWTVSGTPLKHPDGSALQNCNPISDSSWGTCNCPTGNVCYIWDETNNGTTTYLGTDTCFNRWDSAFYNVVIQDTLPFKLVSQPTGTYQFICDSFFRLDNKGLGNEWNWMNAFKNQLGVGSQNFNHNYSFTMTMSRSFVMVPGLKFNFAGDDDIWLFLNNQLVMDLGGPHPKDTALVLVDTVGNGSGAPLQVNQTYNFDLFYCERHSGNSDIEITTNMLVFKQITTKKLSWQRDYGNLN